MAAKKTETELTAPADYFERVANWMRDNGVTNPREIPDAVVESLRGAN